MQAILNAKSKSFGTMRNTITETSSPTTGTSSGQDIHAHVGQSHGDITATIRPRGKAIVGPSKAVQPLARPIRRSRTPPSGPSRHRRVPTATPSTQLHKRGGLRNPLYLIQGPKTLLKGSYQLVRVSALSHHRVPAYPPGPYLQ